MRPAGPRPKQSKLRPSPRNFHRVWSWLITGTITAVSAIEAAAAILDVTEPEQPPGARNRRTLTSWGRANIGIDPLRHDTRVPPEVRKAAVFATGSTVGIWAGVHFAYGILPRSTRWLGLPRRYRRG